jgi:hypothetical protein
MEGIDSELCSYYMNPLQYIWHKEVFRGRIGKEKKTLHALDLRSTGDLVDVDFERRRKLAKYIQLVFEKGLSVFFSWFVYPRYRDLLSKKYGSRGKEMSILLVMSKECGIKFEESFECLRNVTASSFILYIQMLREYYIRNKLTLFNYKNKMRFLFFGFNKRLEIFQDNALYFNRVIRRERKNKQRKINEKERLINDKNKEDQRIRIEKYISDERDKDNKTKQLEDRMLLSRLLRGPVERKESGYWTDGMIIGLPFLFPGTQFGFGLFASLQDLDKKGKVLVRKRERDKRDRMGIGEERILNQSEKDWLSAYSILSGPVEFGITRGVRFADPSYDFPFLIKTIFYLIGVYLEGLIESQSFSFNKKKLDFGDTWYAYHSIKVHFQQLDASIVIILYKGLGEDTDFISASFTFIDLVNCLRG